MDKYIDIINKSSFENKDAFLLFIILGLHIIWYIIKHNNITSSVSFSNTENISNQKNIKYYLMHLPYILKIITASLLIIAIARPQTQDGHEESISEPIEIQIAIDISGSMSVKDMSENPDKTRCDVAKDIGIKFIKKRKGDQIGLVFFREYVKNICLPTKDQKILEDKFNEYARTSDSAGTAIGDALRVCIDRLKSSKIKNDQIIILITDGENRQGFTTPLDEAKKAAEENIKIYTIGIGSDKGRIKQTTAGIDTSMLQEVSKITSGEFGYAENQKKLKEIFDNINRTNKKIIHTKISNTTNEEFYPLVFLAIIFYMTSLIIRFTYLRRIP